MDKDDEIDYTPCEAVRKVDYAKTGLVRRKDLRAALGDQCGSSEWIEKLEEMM